MRESGPSTGGGRAPEEPPRRKPRLRDALVVGAGVLMVGAGVELMRDGDDPDPNDPIASVEPRGPGDATDHHVFLADDPLHPPMFGSPRTAGSPRDRRQGRRRPETKDKPPLEIVPPLGGVGVVNPLHVPPRQPEGAGGVKNPAAAKGAPSAAKPSDAKLQGRRADRISSLSLPEMERNLEGAIVPAVRTHCSEVVITALDAMLHAESAEALDTLFGAVIQKNRFQFSDAVRQALDHAAAELESSPGLTEIQQLLERYGLEGVGLLRALRVRVSAFGASSAGTPRWLKENFEAIERGFLDAFAALPKRIRPKLARALYTTEQDAATAAAGRSAKEDALDHGLDEIAESSFGFIEHQFPDILRHAEEKFPTLPSTESAESDREAIAGMLAALDLDSLYELDTDLLGSLCDVMLARQREHEAGGSDYTERIVRIRTILIAHVTVVRGWFARVAERLSNDRGDYARAERRQLLLNEKQAAWEHQMRFFPGAFFQE